jgi:hypothetical protein
MNWEGILVALVTGSFGLAGIYLSHVLSHRKQQRDEAPTTRPTEPKRSSGKRSVQSAPAKTPIKVSVESREETIPLGSQASRVTANPLLKANAEPRERINYFASPLWWATACVEVAIIVAGALFAGWVIQYVSVVFGATAPNFDVRWLPLVLAGLAWGVVYLWASWDFPEAIPEFLLLPFFGYEGLFSPLGISDFLRGLLSAFPINLVLVWGVACVCGPLASSYAGADSTGVTYIVFGALTFIGVVWHVMESM